MTRYDYFYDEQVKRYLMQVVRAFSGLQYMTGDRGDKPGELRTVPVVRARRNRQIAMIQRNMSENTLLSVPMISVDIVDMEFNREAMQNPSHIDTVHLTERAKDALGNYLDERGNSISVERLMPRPFILTLQVDIWTSNMDQKLQLLEQIDYLMYPGFDIQNSDSAIDWSALTTVTIESQKFSSISVPIGTDNDIDVATLELKLPMWINPPARVSRQTLVNQVITNINEAERDGNGVIIETGKLATVVTTPGNHTIRVERGRITLLGEGGNEHDPSGAVYSWNDLLAQFKTTVRSGETQIRVRKTLSEDDREDIVGVIYETSEPNVVSWQPDIDTLPANTLSSVNGVIDPTRTFPGEGNVPVPKQGHRYLLLDDIATPSMAWGDISARDGSIIEYREGQWVVSFDTARADRVEYVTNAMSGRQLVWNPDARGWFLAIDAQYAPGYWRLVTI